MTCCLLLTENTFHAAYLVQRWAAAFPDRSETAGVALRDNALPGQVLRAREEFHRRHCGERDLDGAAWTELAGIYPDLSESDRAMVGLFGVPGRPAISHDGVIPVGTDVNGERAREWLDAARSVSGRPYIFVFLDRILAPWWFADDAARIVNAHSAVLPNARGMYAIEQVASERDIAYFLDSAGATVHYVDAGVDTGPIISRRRLPDLFASASIWECKARSFALAFDLLVEAAMEAARPAGHPLPSSVPEPSPYGSPEFKRIQFTAQRRVDAETGYLEMKRQVEAAARG